MNIVRNIGVLAIKILPIPVDTESILLAVTDEATGQIDLYITNWQEIDGAWRSFEVSLGYDLAEGQQKYIKVFAILEMTAFIEEILNEGGYVLDIKSVDYLTSIEELYSQNAIAEVYRGKVYSTNQEYPLKYEPIQPTMKQTPNTSKKWLKL